MALSTEEKRKWFQGVLALFLVLVIGALVLSGRDAGKGIGKEKVGQADLRDSAVVLPVPTPPTPGSEPRLRYSTAPLVAYGIKVLPGIYLLGSLEPGAAYVVETTEGVVLVDSGLERDASLLKAEMEFLDLDWKKLRAILITHAHADHCGGAEHLRKATGAKVYAGAGDAGILEAGRPREAFFSIFNLPVDTPDPITVDVALKGGEAITFGNVKFLALATPGHTPGSVCYLMERGNLRALFSGDVISMILGDEESHVHVRNPLGTYSAYLAPRYRGNARDYLSSLRTLRAMPVPDLLLPGHPRADPSPQNPCLTQARWEALLDRGIGEMETLLARYEADGSDFLDGAPKPLLPGLYYLGDFAGVAVYSFFASAAFTS